MPKRKEIIVISMSDKKLIATLRQIADSSGEFLVLRSLAEVGARLLERSQPCQRKRK